MRLIALRTFGHSIGQVFAGQEFEAGAADAEGLINSGAARLAVPIKRETPPGGLSVVILASGGSLTLEDVEACRVWRAARPGAKKVIVINTTFRLALWADLLYACDGGWWTAYAEEVLKTFAGERWTQDKKAAKAFGCRHVELERAPGLSRVRGTINGGGNSGYQAIGVAHELGATRICLLGYDMQRTGGKAHWHGDHPKPLRQNHPYESWRRRFGQLAIDLKASRVEIVNASRATALGCFPRVELAAFLGAP